MLIVVDAGNTTTEIGLFEKGQLKGSFRYITKTKRTSDELAVLFQSFLSLKNFSIDDCDDVIISSVVPDINYTLTSAIIKYFGSHPCL